MHRAFENRGEAGDELFTVKCTALTMNVLLQRSEVALRSANGLLLQHLVPPFVVRTTFNPTDSEDGSQPEKSGGT